MQLTFKYNWTLALSILTPFLLWIVMYLMVGGHGHYLPGIILFPTGLISFTIFRELTVPFMIIGILQFPVYGLLIDKSSNKIKSLFFILTFHALMTLLVFMTTDNL